MDYRKKYIKYKNKYLKLRRNMIGGTFEIDENVVDSILNENKEFATLEIGTYDLFSKKGYAITYGELTEEGMGTIIKELGKDIRGMKYLDLGSGLGNTVVYAIKNGFSSGVGVELAPERHKRAIEMWNNLPADLQRKIKYINGDLLDADVNGFNVIFISNLCFSESMNEKLSNKLKKVNKGTYIIVSKEIPTNGIFRLVKQINVHMTWSTNSGLYIYEKIE